MIERICTIEEPGAGCGTWRGVRGGERSARRAARQGSAWQRRVRGRAGVWAQKWRGRREPRRRGGARRVNCGGEVGTMDAACPVSTGQGGGVSG
jgi:hypothetical protein